MLHLYYNLYYTSMVERSNWEKLLQVKEYINYNDKEYCNV